MTTVQTQVTDTQTLQPFFWLRISGIPYYFFSTVSGTPFAQPNNYPTNWAQHGLMLPKDDVSQKFQDIIGGVATPERMRVELLDFDDPAHPGAGYFSRLFAPGRVLSSLTSNVGQLGTNIAGDGTTSTFNIRGGTFAANTDIYVGSEAIGVSQLAVNSDGTSTATIKQRNKYPAIGDATVATSCFPSVPYHRVGSYDSAGLPTEGAYVSDEIIVTYGRIAAIYMGHMKPDGTAEAEANAACILLGRITSIDTSSGGVGFQLTIDSITADLDKALVGPDLAHDTIVPGYYLTDVNWCRWHMIRAPWIGDTGAGNFELWGSDGSTANTGRLPFQIPLGIYTKTSLIAAINLAMAVDDGDHTSTPLAISLGTAVIDGVEYFQFYCQDRVFNIYEYGTKTSIFSALGFSVNGESGQANNKGSALYQPDSPRVRERNNYTLTAPKPIAQTFIPLGNLAQGATKVSLSTPGSAAQFTASNSVLTNFSGSKVGANVRLDDGKIVTVTSVPQFRFSGVAGVALQLANNTISFGSIVDNGPTSTQGAFYYGMTGQAATVEQVLYDVDDAAGSFARMLCSTTGAAPDTEFNYYPEGAGLGWNNIIAKGDFRIAVDASVGRRMVIDRDTKFSDYFRPVAREYGLFLLWDPATAQIRLRRIQQPSAAAASSGLFASTFIFSEGNRATEKDRTSIKQDRTSMRGTWKLTTGWNGDKFTSSPVLINSLTVRSFFPNDVRQEDIEDKSCNLGGTISLSLASAAAIGGTADLNALIAHLTSHAVIYQFPWLVWRRTVNKTALMLAPGTYHQIVDNTVANPFTGTMGITASDGVFALLGGVTKNYSTGVCAVELYALGTSNKQAAAPWSPCGLIDYAASGNGYNAGTKVLTFVSNYTRQTGKYDGIDFAVGDHVRIVSKHNDNGAQYVATDVIAAISATGQTVTLTTGITTLPTAVHSVMMLDKYHSAQTSRKQGNSAVVTWQGNGSTRKVDTIAGTQLFKWQ